MADVVLPAVVAIHGLMVGMVQVVPLVWNAVVVVGVAAARGADHDVVVVLVAVAVVHVVGHGGAVLVSAHEADSVDRVSCGPPLYPPICGSAVDCTHKRPEPANIPPGRISFRIVVVTVERTLSSTIFPNDSIARPLSGDAILLLLDPLSPI